MALGVLCENLVVATVFNPACLSAMQSMCIVLNEHFVLECHAQGRHSPVLNVITASVVPVHVPEILKPVAQRDSIRRNRRGKLSISFQRIIGGQRMPKQGADDTHE